MKTSPATSIFGIRTFIFFVNGMVQYFLISAVMARSPLNITHNVGKLYLAIIVGLFALILDEFMHYEQYERNFNAPFFIITVCLAAITIYMYRNQIGVSDSYYLDELLEYSSNSRLITEHASLHATDKQVKDFAKKEDTHHKFIQHHINDLIKEL